MERIRLKLDMVYRGFPVEEARAKYAELAAVIKPPVVEAPVKRRRIRPTEGAAELTKTETGAPDEVVGVPPTTMDVLAFYSGSAAAAPGSGANERVADKKRYDALAAIPHWRRRLSNFDTEVTFVWEGSDGIEFPKGTQWRSIEHAFQGAKTALKDKNKALLFTVNSGSPLGLGEGADAQKNRKMVMLNAEELAHWASINDSVMASAARAKYTQHPESLAAQTLRATGDAELWHLMRQRGKPSRLVHFKHLEDLRAEMSK